MPDAAIEIAEYASLESLTPDSRALFGRHDAFSTSAWYAATTAHALPPRTTPAFLLAREAGIPLGVLPMLRGPGRHFAALTTPYTCLWQPILADRVINDPALAIRLGRGFGHFCARAPLTRLDALGDDPSPFLEGLGQSGLRLLRFNHFGNWHLHLPAGTPWPSYLAARPTALRETIRRRTNRLMSQPGARFTAIDTIHLLEAAIEDYENIYAASWKKPEPYPLFNAALMREAAAAGMLRLGLLHLKNTPIAAQIWIVHQGRATVLKLAHAETHRALSPGTVLTARMIQHLLETETITELDFGRGDDPYKKLWTGQRRQRIGMLLANQRTWQGAAAVVRHSLGQKWKEFFSEEKNQNTFVSAPG